LSQIRAHSWNIGASLSILNIAQYPMIFLTWPYDWRKLYILLPEPSFNFIDYFSLTAGSWCGFFNKKHILFLNFFIYMFLPYWSKISFRGKGFRVRKFRSIRKFTFNFGRSHWTRLIITTKNAYSIKIKRQLYVFLIHSRNIFYPLCTAIRRVRPINRYTQRGLRLRHQFIKKRFGKISQVISSLQF